MDLEYCNEHRSYERHGGSSGFDTKDFRRGYVAALFLDNEPYLIAIEKYQMLVPGTRNNPWDAARDAAVKEYLREQVNAETYEARKAFYKAWQDANCCADECEDHCDKCPNKGIKFRSTPTFVLDPDV